MRENIYVPARTPRNPVTHTLSRLACTTTAATPASGVCAAEVEEPRAARARMRRVVGHQLHSSIA